MMKLRIATGLGLLLFMATMIGGPVRVSQAQDDEGVTLASLAGNFAGRGGGFVTICFSPGSVLPLISCSSVSPLAVAVPFYENVITHQTRDAAEIPAESPSRATHEFSVRKILRERK